MSPILLDSLGWGTSVSGALSTALGWALGFFADILGQLFIFLFSIVIQGLFLLFGTSLHTFLLCLLKIVDLFQEIFDVFAGTKLLKYEGEEMYLLDVFLTHDTVKKVLIGMTFIGVALCFIFTIYSVAKSMGSYILEYKRPVSQVMKTALKSCISFMILPVMMYFGSQLASALLISTENAVIGASGTDGTVKLSTVLFLSGTFGDEKEPNASFTTGIRADYLSGKESIYNPINNVKHFNMYPTLDVEKINSLLSKQADAVDVKETAMNDVTTGKSTTSNYSLDDARVSSEDKFSTEMLNMNIFGNVYNYPLVYTATLGVILIMICSIFVFIRKIIEVVILYITSPIFVATMPLDEGATFKKWRDLFIGKLLSGFGIVITMNLALIFIPIVMNSSFSFSSSNALDTTMKTIFMVGSLYAAWKCNSTILEVINPEVAAADKASAMVVAALVKKAGDAAMTAATGGASAAAKGAASAAKGAGEAAKGAADAAKGAGNAFKGGAESPGKMSGIGNKGASGGDKGASGGDKGASGGDKGASGGDKGASGDKTDSISKFKDIADSVSSPDNSEDEEAEQKQK